MRIERSEVVMASEISEAGLGEVPDVRAEMIARGKALIADPNYPSREHMKRVAQLLAGKLRDGAGTEAALGISSRYARQERVDVATCCE
jgi:hypothetical protein